jgi:hypothetical protein
MRNEPVIQSTVPEEEQCEGQAFEHEGPDQEPTNFPYFTKADPLLQCLHKRAMEKRKEVEKILSD